MVRLGWVQHLMAGLGVERDRGRNTRFVAPEKQIPEGNDSKKGKSNSNGNSRFPKGMTVQKQGQQQR
jgi:hypothetical protein